MFGRVGTHLFRHTKSSSHVIKASSGGTHHEKFSFTWTGFTPTIPGDGELEITRCRDHRSRIFASKIVIRYGNKKREKEGNVRVSTQIRIHGMARSGPAGLVLEPQHCSESLYADMYTSRKLLGPRVEIILTLSSSGCYLAVIGPNIIIDIIDTIKFLVTTEYVIHQFVFTHVPLHKHFR